MLCQVFFFTFESDQMFEPKFSFVHWVLYDLDSSKEVCETLAAILPSNTVLFLQVG